MHIIFQSCSRNSSFLPEENTSLLTFFIFSASIHILYLGFLPNFCPQVLQLRDFLDKICVLDPAKRITLNQCLTHPFIQVLINKQAREKVI